jgi:hypothetical protein
MWNQQITKFTIITLDIWQNANPTFQVHLCNLVVRTLDEANYITSKSTILFTLQICGQWTIQCACINCLFKQAN